MLNKNTKAWISILFLSLSTPFSGSQAKLPAQTFTLLILGDSLTEGFGVPEEEAFPARLEKLFSARGFAIKVINGGTSGSTSASGVSKLKWYARAQPDALIITLGSNDGLRGVSPEATKKNLEEVISFAKQKKWQVYLAGLQVPPNYGPEYTEKFKKVYPRLAKENKLPLLPFLLKDVAGEPENNLPDGIHPNPKGHAIIAQNVYDFLAPFLLTSKEP